MLAILPSAAAVSLGPPKKLEARGTAAAAAIPAATAAVAAGLKSSVSADAAPVAAGSAEWSVGWSGWGTAAAGWVVVVRRSICAAHRHVRERIARARRVERLPLMGRSRPRTGTGML